MLFQPDAFSLLFTNGITALAAASVLLASRRGLGNGASRVRTWILADVIMFLGRLILVGETLCSDWMIFSLGSRVLSGGALVTSLLWHNFSLERLGGQRRSVTTMMQLSVLAGVGFVLVGAQLPDGNPRHLWIMLMCTILSARFLVVLKPLRANSWGARIMFGTMAMTLLFGGLASVVDVEKAKLQMLLMVLFMDLMISLIMTFSFSLCLQERLRQRIEELLVTDALTGSLNRYGLIPTLERDLRLSPRSGQPLSVALFDLDYFKRINDLHGHAMGDAVLRAFAAIVKSQIRKTDLFGRWGGEEFLLVLPHTSLMQAHELCERIRARLASAPLVEGHPGVTVSAGVAQASELDAGQPGPQARVAPRILRPASCAAAWWKTRPPNPHW